MNSNILYNQFLLNVIIECIIQLNVNRELKSEDDYVGK